MTYRWQAEPTTDAAGLDQLFDDQAAAEAWLSDNYLELSEDGVQAVSLFEQDRLVYGPMPLGQA